MKINKQIQFFTHIIISLGLLSLALVTTVATATNNNKELKQRLETLSQQLEEKRKEFHIPGMAMAIVKNNKVIFAKGFGVRDLETQKPVKTDTVFAIGSTTKAFTATLISMLVDEGKMQWDDPITKYLPHLKFNLENKSDEITLRDMMSHQTGFTRFNLLYANGKVAREEILQEATKAEPWAGFREKFLYNNLMVSAAGVAAAKRVNTDWDSLLEERLLKPLAMKNTTSRYDVVHQNSKLSKGYMWLEEQGKHKKLTMHDVTNIGPAGAINSNVKDMAKWLKLQLANGKYKGKKIVSANQIKETRKPQIKIGSGVHYGLGWMLRNYKGKAMVAHDGSVEGYSAIVAMLPESDVGFVLLTNVTSTAMLGTSMNMVWQALEERTNDKVATKETTTKIAYEDFIGEYIANFANFNDTVFTFHIKDGKPYVDVPGQTDYELKAPDEDGKMYFAMTDTIAVSFDKNKTGEISAMRMYQGSMKFEIPKKGVEIEPEIEPGKLQKYLGVYTIDSLKRDLKVFIQNHRLTVDIPGEMAFELKLPDENGHRFFRIKDNMSVSFDSNEKDQITALNLFRSGKKMGTALKTISQDTEKLPTLAEILELRQVQKHKKSLANSKGFHLKGKITMKQSGIIGHVTTRFQGYDSYREEVNLGQYGSIITALNSNQGATAPSFASFTEHHGKYFQQFQKLHPSALIDWEHYFDDIQIVGTDTFKDKQVYIIKLKNGKSPTSQIFVDKKTGDVLKQETALLNPTVGSIPVTTIYEDYQEVHGLRVPYIITVKNDFNGESVFELESMEANLDLNEDLYILENPNSAE
jgi:CubicO group peptidase (beta-lactamase class C family)